MPLPFPGMDPYLEQASLWPNVHTSLIVALRDDLAPRLRPRYYVAVEERTVRLSADDVLLAMRPDIAVVQPPASLVSPVQSAVATATVAAVTVEVPLPDDIREVYLHIRTVDTDEVITTIEVLSTTNKLITAGRHQYERKRLDVFGSRTHLVEIDLLRAGDPMPLKGTLPPQDYRLLVSQANQRPKAPLFAFGLRQPIPSFSLPLQADDAEPVVVLNDLFHALYDRAGYDLRIDYTAEPPPPALSAEDRDWLDQHLRAAGLR
ncbi:MAG: DUF4058 family protein [Chloroflexaceae bacterium]|nr:DUF4058 family protein [Chloroflexaceae bacterium]